VQPARQPLVLVIERSTELNHFIADSLRRDFHVVQAFNGREGLERARKVRPALIVCDAGIPVSGSTELITEMRRQRDLAGTPVLILSNGHDEHARLRLFEEGSQDFITRPFSRREMCLRARNLVAIMEARRREREEAAVAEALYRVSAAFSRELDPQKLVQRVTDEATALTGAEFGAFFFNVEREDGGRYMLHTLSGASADAFAHFPMPRATPLFGPTFRGETVIRSDDIRRDPRYGRMGGLPEGHLPVVSYLAVPVIGREGKVHGGLFFGHGEPGRFTAVHERIVKGLAAQAAVAMEKARLYEALRRSEARARDADRRKDEFLAMLGHELRNPLAPIMTALEVMELRGEGNLDAEKGIIRRQVRHLSRLVDDLLDVSRVARGKIQIRRERVDLAAVIDRATEMASPLFEQRHHHLCLDVARTGLHVDGDPERLAQVISNLLTNAARYTEPGGRVDVRAAREGDRICVSVKDTGRGIPRHLLAHIFDLFVQGGRAADRAPGGLGIGLALVRNLVELHGGNVRAKSEGPGTGSEFVIELPAARLRGGECRTGPEEIPARRQAGSRVLVVDDNTDAANVLADALRLYGHEVMVALDGPQALAIAARFEATAALLDIGLPAMDGYEVARRLRECWAGRSVWYVAVTGYGQDSDKEKARAEGFHAHFSKPVRLADLVRLLNEDPPDGQDP